MNIKPLQKMCLLEIHNARIAVIQEKRVFQKEFNKIGWHPHTCQELLKSSEISKQLFNLNIKYINLNKYEAYLRSIKRCLP